MMYYVRGPFRILCQRPVKLYERPSRNLQAFKLVIYCEVVVGITYETWIRYNNLVRCWILNSEISPIVQSFWEELEIFHPIPHCTCIVRCECDSMHNSAKFNDEDLILLFLTGVIDQYAMRCVI